MTHKKSSDARLLIFCLSLIRYGNITTTRSSLITSRWSLFIAAFPEISCIIRSSRHSRIRRRRNARPIFAGRTPAASTQIYLSAITLSYSFIYLCTACGTQIRAVVVAGCRESQIWIKLKFRFGQSREDHVKPRSKFHWNSNVSGKQYGARCWNVASRWRGRGRTRNYSFSAFKSIYFRSSTRNSLQN